MVTEGVPKKCGKQEIGYISAVYISEEYRIKGLARELERKICDDFFSKKELKFIELNCLTKNQSALKCWNNLGYVTFREQLRKSL